MRFLKLLPLLLACWLYAFVVQMPFYSDDIEFYTYLHTIQPIEILTRADANGLYWRPLPQATYYFLAPHAPTWHLIILATHVVNIALVGTVARRLRLNVLAQLIAMSVFAVFPFGVQAVAWVLSWGHVLSTTLLLASVWCFLHTLSAHTVHRARWLFATVICGCLAPLTHENGILVLPLLGLLCVWTYSTHTTHRHIGTFITWLRTPTIWRTVVPIAIVHALYWVYRGSLVTSKINLSDDLPARFVKFLAFFAQGISLPIQLFSAPFATENAVTTVWIGVFVFALLCGLVLWRNPNRGAWGVFVLAWAWWFVASLPTVIALPPHYNIQYDERLLYVTMPAIALLFGVVLSRLRRLLAISASVALVVSMFLIASIYAQYWGFMGDGWNIFFQTTQKISPDKTGLVINFPRFMERATPFLPLMRPNAMMMQIEFTLRDIIWTNTRQEYPLWQGVTYLDELTVQPFPFVLDVWQHYIGYGEFVTREQLVSRFSQYDIITRFIVRDGKYVVETIGERVTASDSAPFAIFDNRLALQRATYANGYIELEWQKIAPIDQPLVAFVHVLCADDSIATQSDSVPLAGYYGFEAWQVGDTWRENRYLPTPDVTCNRLRVGVYRADNSQNLPIQTGESWVILGNLP
jgi:hypothetical protein